MARRLHVRLFAALFCLLLLATATSPGPAAVLDAQDRPLRAMVLTGQNNHGWQVLSEHYRSIPRGDGPVRGGRGDEPAAGGPT